MKKLIASLLFVGACDSAPAVTAPVVEGAASVDVPWQTVEPVADGIVLSAPARVVTQATARADVNPASPGIVREVSVMPGDTVVAGQKIAEMTAPDLAEAAATVLGARRQLRVCRARRAHVVGLRKAGLAKKDLLFELDVAVARLEAQLGRALALLRASSVPSDVIGPLARTGVLPLRAPISGVVIRVHARLGHAASPDDPPLLEIQGQAEARVEALVAGEPVDGAQARFVSADGRIIALIPKPVNRVIEAPSGLRRVWFDFIEPAALGTDVPGQLQYLADGPAYAVPAAAVACRESCRLRRLRGGEAQAIVVQALWVDGGSAIVQGDLRPTDQVAAEATGTP